MDTEKVLIEEYKMVSSGADRYFDFLYRGVSMSLIFFTTVFLYALNEDTEYPAKQIIFLYIIPVFFYVLGLIYCYNLCALAKLGFMQVKI